MLIHATSIAINNKAVLLTGAPGVGKSDVALRLIMEHGATLISDDQTLLEKIEQDIPAQSRLRGAAEGGVPQSSRALLTANTPASIAGVFEARHVGLLHMPYVSDVEVALYIELVGAGVAIPRLPEDGDSITLLDCPIRKLCLPGFAASTPAKIRAALLYPPSGD